jgi:hypothetical protein
MAAATPAASTGLVKMATHTPAEMALPVASRPAASAAMSKASAARPDTGPRVK